MKGLYWVLLNDEHRLQGMGIIQKKVADDIYLVRDFRGMPLGEPVSYCTLQTIEEMKNYRFFTSKEDFIFYLKYEYNGG